MPALFRPRRVWLPTVWGLLLIGGALALLSLMLARQVHGFFAIDQPLPADASGPVRVLVVEGWIGRDALAQAAAVVRAAGYRHVITSGGPINDDFSRHRDFATRAADSLRPALPPGVRLDAVPAPHTAQDRSYASAVWVRDWARREGLAMARFDVLTHDIHARRTRLIYRMAFGPEVQVGIRATHETDHDMRRWWTSSAAFKAQIAEALSLAYTHCCFWPAPRGSHEERWAVPPGGEARPGAGERQGLQ